jgi:hypothetical protein
LALKQHAETPRRCFLIGANILNDVIKNLSEKLDWTAPALATLDNYWNGTQPAAFLSPEASRALGNRMRTLAVNFPRLAVDALEERLQVTGFQFDNADRPDQELWKIWTRNRMVDASAQAHTDALVYGRSFVMVWSRPDGSPSITIESPKNMAVAHNPLTREVDAAFKRWSLNGKGYGVLYLVDRIVKVESTATVSDEVFPTTGWNVVETIPNPLGVCPGGPDSQPWPSG